MTITSLSSNFGYGTTSAIRSEERLHWYLGLRKAELMIETSLRPALQFSLLDLKKLTRKKDELSNLSVKTEEDSDEIIRLTEEIRQIEIRIPDAILELEESEFELARIMTEHQHELGGFTKEQLIQQHSKKCHLARASRFVAGYSLRSLGYNDSEAQLLLEMPPEDQLEVMSQMQMSNSNVVVALFHALNRINPVDAQQILESVEAQVTQTLMIKGESN